MSWARTLPCSTASTSRRRSNSSRVTSSTSATRSSPTASRRAPGRAEPRPRPAWPGRRRDDARGRRGGPRRSPGCGRQRPGGRDSADAGRAGPEGRSQRRPGDGPLPPHVAIVPFAVRQRHRPRSPAPRRRAFRCRAVHRRHPGPLHRRGDRAAGQRGAGGGGVAVTTAPADVVEAALAGRKELALIAEPSVAAVGAVLAARCRNPADPRGRRARRSRRPRRTAPAPRAARHRALTVDELLGVRVGDAGSLDAAGRLVPDLDAEPLALEYSPTEGGQRRLTFLPFEARAAVQERLAGGYPGPSEPLLLPGDAAAAVSSAAAVRSAALI